jgi:acetate CoA/acetoacetate CoA-transferase beta subunit
MLDVKNRIAKRIAQEFKDGDLVNLGIGLPTLVANYIPDEVNVILHSENGLVGLGPTPLKDEEDKDLINAGGQSISFKSDAAFFDSATSFAIIRGGHLDATVLGALQVDQNRNLANWMVPKKLVPGMGGAMDLTVGAKRVIIATTHLTKKGEPKILKECTLPLTARGEVDMIITDMAVLEFTKEGLVLKEIAEGIELKDVIDNTDAELIISDNLKTFS